MRSYRAENVTLLVIVDSRPTWGLISCYYSSFFAAQAAIRLKGRAFVRLDYTSEEEANMPTYLLETLNFVTNRFRVRRAGRLAEHHRVWNAFSDLYSGFADRSGCSEFSPVTSPQQLKKD